MDYSPFLPMTNCCVFDAEKMLKDTIKVGNATMKEPKSILVASAQLVQIIGSIAGSQYGGISVHDIDNVLEYYAKKNYEKHLRDADTWGVVHAEQYAKTKTIEDIYSAMQGFEHEINSLTGSTGQAPFVSISFGYHTSWIAREIQKAILNVRMNKLGDGTIAIFPKLIYFHKKGINFEQGEPNYDIKQLAIKCASTSMYPDILNVDRLIEITGHRVTPMGCRSFLPNSYNNENVGRNNLGVLTLNLVRIGLESEGDIDKFWRVFRERMNIIKEALVYRYERVKQATPKNAPILFKQGALGKKLSDNDSVDELYTNKRATISVGYIGVYETVASIYGVDWYDNQKAVDFSLEILKRMKKYTDKWTEELNLWVSVYGTPSESLCFRFNQLDTEKFGSVEGITDKDYYTNSFHVDVEKEISPFEKLEFESKYEPYTSGGLIHYTEYPDVKNNLEAIETVWNYSYDKSMYLGTNCPIDKCFVCKYEGDFTSTEYGYECPSCGNKDSTKMDVIKRLCGLT